MKIRKIVFSAAVLLSLAGCAPSAKQLSYPVLPDELKDCKFYIIDDGSASYMKVARCPTSQTSVTYPMGKGTASSTVIDQ